ncbi:hypothetical protein EW026_g6964 [Hermanssonia centrifuga]|uniref:Uncharacterized protein n=1 Tax=Hermanssonia centrifuga TaxID=98765 RepID=A0A4S4K9D1_9APHY|nr:hypothetical protein EW026_g6964 [Hermanssonia centrifuga]
MEQSAEEKELDRLRTLVNAPIYKTTAVDDARTISPWLNATNWHNYTQPYDPAVLRQTVVPAKDDYPILPEAIEAYMQNATALIEETDELTLQTLNTEDPSMYWTQPYSFSFISGSTNFIALW